MPLTMESVQGTVGRDRSSITTLSSDVRHLIHPPVTPPQRHRVCKGRTNRVPFDAELLLTCRKQVNDLVLSRTVHMLSTNWLSG
jgi:hypothetical protein